MPKKTSTSTKPRGKKSSARPTASKPRRNGKCSACGFGGGLHSSGCPNGRCPECDMMAGSHELSCSMHPTLNGTTGAVIDTEVDGKSAKFDARARAAADDAEEADRKKGITRIAAPPLKNAAKAIAALQRALDDKSIFAIKQPLTTSVPCEHEWYDEKSEQSVGCAHAAAFDRETKKTCPTCQKTATAKDEKLCVIHEAMKQMGELPERQTSMFDADEPADGDDALELED